MSRQLTSAALATLLAAACSSQSPGESKRVVAPGASPELAVNGGFEDGTLSGWNVDAFTRPTTGITVPPTSEADLNLGAGGTDTSSAVTSPAGVNLGTVSELGLTGLLHFPIFGSWSALVNDQSSNVFGHANNVNKLSQTYTVTAADIDPSDGQIHVRLVVAPILEDGGHPAGQQPYVFIQAVNISKGTVIGTDFTSANQAGINWTRQTSPITGLPVVYTGWRLVDFAPGNAALQPGDSVFVEIVAAGCATGSHVGEVLVDSVGSTVPGLAVSVNTALQVNANANLTYNHAVHNGGVLAGTNVTVTQPVLPGTSFVSVTAPVTASCTAPTVGATSGNVVCNMGTVNAAATANLGVTLKAPAATGTLLNANAKVSADGGAALNANQVLTNIVQSVRFADVKLSIDDGAAALGWGGTTTYSVNVANAGPASASAVTLTIPPPLNALNTAWSCTPTTGGPLIVALPQPGLGQLVSVFSMPANSSLSCSYTAQVIPGAGPGTLTLSGTAADLTTVNPIPADGTAADQDQLSTALVDIAVAKEAAGNGAGVVVSAPAQINCGSACTGQFVPGVPIALTATGNRGSQFTSWSGTFCNGSPLPVCTFTPSADTTVTARFDKLTFPINVSVSGSGTVVCPTVAVVGSSVSCIITPAPGFQLSALTDNGTDVTAQVAAGVYLETNVQAGHDLSGTFVKINGVLCSSSDECGSGICTDGVCCSTACNGACEACDLPGTPGICLPIKIGLLPEPGHAACGGTGACAGACDGMHGSSCSFPGGETSCRAASCTGGVETFPAGCQGDGTCPIMAAQSCGAFACGETSCKVSCNGDGDCASGSFCNAAHACVPKQPQAGSCTANDQCGSGQCVDGVCCDTACGGQCQACDVAGHAGTCTTLTSGEPHGPRPTCAGDGSLCSGSCDGTSAAQCDFPGAGTQCAPASCKDGVATVAVSCNALGACASVSGISCGTFACNAAGTACNVLCNSDADCASSAFCSDLHLCLPKKDPGTTATCTKDDQCSSGHCTDGFCCDTACNGQCQACDVPGSQGTCTADTAGDQPHGDRTACAGDGSSCGGSCDGTHTAACTFPGSETQCREGSCVAGSATLAASCNGAGSCPTVQVQVCAPFVCGAGSCQGNCQADSDCQSGDFCAAGVCQPKKAPGGSCSATDQCGSGFCVDGVCCDTSCDGQCQACNVAGSVGTCTAVTGAPQGSRTACAGGSSCVAGACIATSPDVITLAGTPGCSSGGGSIAPILGLVMFALFRMHKRRSLAALKAVGGRRAPRPG